MHNWEWYSSHLKFQMPKVPSRDTFGVVNSTTSWLGCRSVDTFPLTNRNADDKHWHSCIYIYIYKYCKYVYTFELDISYCFCFLLLCWVVVERKTINPSNIQGIPSHKIQYDCDTVIGCNWPTKRRKPNCFPVLLLDNPPRHNQIAIGRM